MLIMPPTFAILANPAAGGTSREEKHHLLRRAARILKAEVYGLDTTSVADFQNAARDLSMHVDVLVVAGGDKSLDDVVNAVTTGNSDVELGFLPMGSGNGFAYAIGLPSDVGDAAQQIRSGSAHRVDVMQYQGPNDSARCFLGGIGLEPAVVIDRGARLRRHKPLLNLVQDDLALTRMLDPVPGTLDKAPEGFVAYLFAALYMGLNGYKPIQAKVTVDGMPYTHDRVLSMVFSTHPFYGYGLNVNRHANLQDERVHVSTTYDPESKIGRVSKGVLCAAQGFFFGGNRLCSTQAGQEMTVQTAEPVPIQLGGDYHATEREFSFRVEPGAVAVRY